MLVPCGRKKNDSPRARLFLQGLCKIGLVIVSWQETGYTGCNLSSQRRGFETCSSIQDLPDVRLKLSIVEAHVSHLMHRTHLSLGKANWPNTWKTYLVGGSWLFKAPAVPLPQIQFCRLPRPPAFVKQFLLLQPLSKAKNLQPNQVSPTVPPPRLTQIALLMLEPVSTSITINPTYPTTTERL